MTFILWDDDPRFPRQREVPFKLTVLDRRHPEDDDGRYRAPPSYGKVRDLNARIDKIEPNGQVYIKFSEDVLTFPNCSEWITPESLRLEFEQQPTDFEPDIIDPPEWDWVCDSYPENDTLVLNLTFDDPLLVSQ